MFKKILSFTVIICFFLNTVVFYPQAHADSVLGLPAPGTMVNLSPAYMPVMIKGVRVHPDNPLLFDFILDAGDSRLKINSAEFKTESQKLIKYFLAALTIKEDDLWVNLSPYEKDRMISQELGKTEMGQDMLAEDYILKQLTASLIYPERALGKKFWDNVYTKARQMYGVTDIPVNTFNKVWIVADKAKVLERNNAAYVVGAHLKVMLEEDYMSLHKHSVTSPLAFHNDSHSMGANIVREIILPQIEKEVNQGQNFAPLRQMFYSMILATWYKTALKNAFLNQVYSDKAKTSGVLSDDPTVKEKIYQQYLQAYKKGVFNYIKEDIDQTSKQMVPRKYFSGGIPPNFDMDQVFAHEQTTSPSEQSSISDGHDLAMVSLEVVKATDKAMTIQPDKRPGRITQLAREFYWKHRLAAAGAVSGWRAGSVVSLEPRVHLPDHILDNVAVPFVNFFPESRKMLDRPNGIYQYMNDDKSPLGLDLSRSAGSYFATIDRDPKGNPYYFINFDEFAIHALGYNRPELVEAFFRNPYEVINRTAYSDFVTSAYAAYVHMMMSIRPEGLDHLFITNTGAESTENAIKAVKLKRPESQFMIGFEHAFHGRTPGAMSVTEKRVAVEGFFKFDWPKVSFPDTSEEEQRHSLSQIWSLLITGDPKQKDALVKEDIFNEVLAELDTIIQDDLNSQSRFTQAERQSRLQERIEALRKKYAISLKEAARVTGVIVEPYQGEGGMNFTDAQYFQRLRYLTTLFDVPLIFDEVQSGFFVTGKVWAHQNFNLGIPPDIITFAKKAQMGGMYMNDRYFVYEHGKINSTWGGSEGGFIRAVEYERIIRAQGLDKRIHELGEYALSELRLVKQRINATTYPPFISNVRGLGLVLALDFPSAALRDEVEEQALRRGLIVNRAGEKTIRILPRFDTKTYTIDEAFDILEAAAIQVAHDHAMHSEPLGGIDLNAKNMGLDVAREGKAIEMKFDPAMIAEFQKGNFTGVQGIILRIVPIESPLPFLGLETSPMTALKR